MKDCICNPFDEELLLEMRFKKVSIFHSCWLGRKKLYLKIWVKKKRKKIAKVINP